MDKKFNVFPIVYAFLFMVFSSACSNVYFDALEKIGISKRELMVSRLNDAMESQTAAKDQFKSALDHYKGVVRFEGGKLEEKYTRLNTILEESEASAKRVKDDINDVRDVAVALFKEWNQELDQYESQRLRSDSERKLEASKKKYSQMMASMKIASMKLDPALAPLRDNVLYLKHNLNAQAISALGGELRSIEVKVEDLIRELTRAIEEAEAYILSIQQT